MRALSIAATGMQAQQTNVEVIANNLANMNTTGFKEQRAEFAGPALPERRDPGRADLRPGHLCAQRHPARRRRARPRRSIASPPRAICSPPAIPMTSPSRARAISASSRPTAPTPIPARAISRFRPQGQLVTQDGLLVQPGIAIPANTTQRHHQRPGPGQCHGAGQHHAADRGPA